MTFVFMRPCCFQLLPAALVTLVCIKHTTCPISNKELSELRCNTPIIKRWVVNQDHVKGFLMKQECTSTHI
jgi:hypothetical protein